MTARTVSAQLHTLGATLRSVLVFIPGSSKGCVSWMTFGVPKTPPSLRFLHQHPNWKMLGHAKLETSKTSFKVQWFTSPNAGHEKTTYFSANAVVGNQINKCPFCTPIGSMGRTVHENHKNQPNHVGKYTMGF